MNLQGIYRGVCINNLDPAARGRVQVMVPALNAAGGGSWALPCRALGIPASAPPQIGESVWVMFEQGDSDRPVVIGTLPE